MSSDNKAVRIAAAHVGAASRFNLDELPDRKRDLATELLADYIEKIVAKAPPLSPAQRDRLAALLTPAVADDTDAVAS